MFKDLDETIKTVYGHTPRLCPTLPLTLHKSLSLHTVPLKEALSYQRKIWQKDLLRKPQICCHPEMLQIQCNCLPCHCCQFTLAFSISTSFDVGLLDYAAALRYWDLVVTDIWVWWFGVLRYIYIDVGIIIWVGLEFGTLVEMRLLVV